MLGKLIKYDLKSMSKIMFPFWIAMMISGVILGIQIRMSDMRGMINIGGEIGRVIVILILGTVIAASFVVCAILIIQRFWKGLLREEGYLMFTLPVSGRSLIVSKAVSGLLIAAGTIAAVGFTIVFILGVAGFGVIRYVNFVFYGFEAETIKWMVYTAVLAVIQILNAIYHTYAAMSLGQLSNKNRFMMSFAAYIAISLILNILLIPVLNINEGWSMDSFAGIYLLIAAVEVILYHIITEYILTKKLNLE